MLIPSCGHLCVYLTAIISFAIPDRPAFPSFASTMLSALPDVMIQSVMHLSAKEILTFARCSRFTLQCADSAFAWRECVCLPLPVITPFTDPPPPMSRMLRWLPCAVAWKSDCQVFADEVTALVKIADGVCIAELANWTSDLQLSDELLTRLLTHSSMQRLRALSLDCVASRAMFELAAQLPHLSALRVRLGGPLDPSDPSHFLLLSAAPSLTQLHVHDSEAGAQASCVPFVSQLPLRSLSLTHTRVSRADFKYLSEASAMSRLHELHLHHCDCPDLYNTLPKVLSARFAALASLRTLTFDADMLFLIPALRHAPSLSRVIITYSYQYLYSELVPMEALLKNKPEFRLEMRFWGPDANVQLTIGEFHPQFHDRVTLCSTPHPPSVFP